jgi:hypothetical protein
MDFKVVTKNILDAFRAADVRYSLIGGFALGVWEAGRSTVDMDFLVHRDDLDKIGKIMAGLGYECKYKTENVSQYVSSLKIFGEIDFIHAFRKASLEMLGRAKEKEIFNGEMKIRVLCPEDLIGLKLQAMRNNPSREQTDRADIEALVSLHREKLDWELLEGYFKLFEMEDSFKKLRDK